MKKTYDINYKFAILAKAAEIQLHEHSSLYDNNSFLKPVFNNPNSYINVLGDIIFVKSRLNEGMTTGEIEERCKCKMTHTINRLRLSGLITHDKKTGYVPTSLGNAYWNAACEKFRQEWRGRESKPISRVIQAELPL